MQATALLSPNGHQTSLADGPATRIFIATIEGVRTLERASPSAPWALTAHSLNDRHVGALVIEPRSGKLYAGAHGGDGGVWVSDDGAGARWRRLTNGLTSQNVYSLALRQRHGGARLFAGVEPAAIFRSDDLGESWRELPALRNVPGTEKWTFPAPPHIAHVKSITVDQRRPGTLYACVEQGALLKSGDDGESWVELDGYVLPDDATYRDTHRLVIHPANPDVIYLATGLGLGRSDDGGAVWTALTRRGGRLGYPDFMFVDPRDHDIFYMAGAATTPTAWMKEHTANAAVIKSVDGGRTWREALNGLPHPIVGLIEAMCLHQWPGGMMLAIATATGEVHASDDAGESWSCLATGLAPVSKSGHYRAFVPGARSFAEAPLRA